MKPISEEQRERWLRYALSAGLSALLLTLLAGVAVWVLRLQPNRAFGATQLVVRLGDSLSGTPPPAFKAAAAEAEPPTALPSTGHPQSQSASASSQKAARKRQKQPTVRSNPNDAPQEDFAPADFEPLLTGTGKQRQKSASAAGKANKPLQAGVHYGNDSDPAALPSDFASSADAFDGEGAAPPSALSDNSRGRLQQIAASASSPGETGTAAEIAAESETVSDASGGPTLSDGSDAVTLDEYRKKRRMIDGDFPSLEAVDLAGRRYITAVVRLGVDASGIVQKVSIVSSSGSLEIDSAIKRALRYWKFERMEGAHYEEPLLKLVWRPGK